jgi:hypothetical protein
MNEQLTDLMQEEERAIVRLHVALFNLPASKARAVFEAFLLPTLMPKLALIRTGFIPLVRREGEEPAALAVPPLGEDAELLTDRIRRAVAGRQVTLGGDGGITNAVRVKVRRLPAKGMFASFQTEAGLLGEENGVMRRGQFLSYAHPDDYPDYQLLLPLHRVFPVWDEVEIMRTVVIAYDAWIEEMQQRLAYDALAGEKESAS